MLKGGLRALPLDSFFEPRAAVLGPSLCLLLSGCTLLLDFDQPIAAGDAGGLDASLADAGADAAAPLYCDAFEPNNELATAQELQPAIHDAASCPEGDQDFYSFALLADSAVSITLSFAPGTGQNLDMRLYDAQGTIISQASGVDPTEEISHSLAQGNPLPGGTYQIEVYPAEGSAGSLDYQLDLKVTPNAS